MPLSKSVTHLLKYPKEKVQPRFRWFFLVHYLFGSINTNFSESWTLNSTRIFHFNSNHSICETLSSPSPSTLKKFDWSPILSMWMGFPKKVMFQWFIPCFCAEHQNDEHPEIESSGFIQSLPHPRSAPQSTLSVNLPDESKYQARLSATPGRPRHFYSGSFSNLCNGFSGPRNPEPTKRAPPNHGTFPNPNSHHWALVESKPAHFPMCETSALKICAI